MVFSFKQIILKPYFWLFLSLLLLAAALGVSRLDKYQSLEKRQLSAANNISQQLHYQLKEIEKQTDLNLTHLQHDTAFNFQNLLEHSQFPVFIFKNKEPLFWSAYRIQPEYTTLAGNYQYKLIAVKNGKLVATRRFFVSVSRKDTIEIFTLLPLYTKFSVENNYLKPTWDFALLEGFDIGTSVSVRRNENIFAPDGSFLFSVVFSTDFRLSEYLIQNIYTFLLLVSISIAVFALWLWASFMASKGKIEGGFLGLLLGLVGLRYLMLWANFPFEPSGLDLFNPRYYASSRLTPSLGDLLLSLSALALIFWYLLKYGLSSSAYQQIHRWSQQWRWALATTIIWLSYWVFYLTFSILRTLYFDSQWSLDFATSLSVNSFKFIAWGIFVLLAVLFFFCNYLLARVFLRVIRLRTRAAIFSMAIGAAAYVITAAMVEISAWVLLPLNAIYWLLIFLGRFPKFLTRPTYQTYLYFFTTAVVCALVGSYSLYDFKIQESLQNRRKMAEQLAGNTDALAEYLLQDMILKIQSDEFIQRRMISIIGSKDLIIKKIKKAYIENYFDRYDLNISLYSSDGRNFNSSEAFGSLSDWHQYYAQPSYATQNANIFFLTHPNPNTLKEYACIIPIAGNTNEAPIIGHIVVDFKQQKGYASNVYPELLLDQKMTPFFQPQGYSYALYDSLKVVLAFGNFDYEKDWNVALFSDTTLYDDGLDAAGWKHLAMRGEGNSMVLVSAPPYPFKYLFSNFSFLFLILIFGAIILIVSYLVYQRLLGKPFTLSATIQLYLNGAFLLPMAAVSFFTVNIISNGYRRDLDRVLANRTEAVSRNLVPYMEKYVRNEIPRENMEQHVQLMASYTGLDINLFDTHGQLILSSQPSIYEKELLASRINPWAIVEIQEKHHGHLLQKESVGLFSYNIVYEAIRTSNTGQLLGIVSVPFFDSSKELDKQVADVFNTIINIFTVIFIVFLMLSYYASQRLVVPLRLITQRLNRTSLHSENEPLYWPRRDEIGMLVNEYNKMLQNLAENKIALSRSEKESAWREMAQQVAHEIKNPLTPMKLTLQYLQNAMQKGHPNLQGMTEKAANTLLVQIENLSDIANSFSAFAKMPTPRTELFDVAQTLRETVALYQANENTEIVTTIPDAPCLVWCDEKLMSRIFTNLIINGIQAVPQERTPTIEITLTQEKSKCLIRVADNGSGIPSDIQHKVFLPNFSTKYSGSGIGLALAKRGIEHAGGQIWFETQEGTGTIFFISLEKATLKQ